MAARRRMRRGALARRDEGWRRLTGVTRRLKSRQDERAAASVGRKERTEFHSLNVQFIL